MTTKGKGFLIVLAVLAATIIGCSCMTVPVPRETASPSATLAPSHTATATPMPNTPTPVATGTSEATPTRDVTPTSTPWWSEDSDLVASSYAAYSAQTENFDLARGEVIFEIDSTAPIEVQLVHAVSEASRVIFSGGPEVGVEVFADVVGGTYRVVVIMQGEGTWAIWIWQ